VQCKAALLMPERRFPPPWTVEDIGAAFVVTPTCDATVIPRPKLDQSVNHPHK
jgi:hypothetical protein